MTAFWVTALITIAMGAAVSALASLFRDHESSGQRRRRERREHLLKQLDLFTDAHVHGPGWLVVTRFDESEAVTVATARCSVCGDLRCVSVSDDDIEDEAARRATVA